MLQTDRTISLPCGVNDIKNFAINHCDFYFLDRNGCKLIKWSPNTQAIETIGLEQNYLCICYDLKENCYWAIPACEPYLIHRLDVCFCKVGHIVVKGACQQRAISICCDCCGNGLWVCYPWEVAYVEKCSKKETWEKQENTRRTYLGLTTQCICRISCYYEGCRQFIEVISACDGESIELCIPIEYKIAGLAACSCNHSGKDCRFCVLLSKTCSYEFVLMEYCVDFSAGIIEPCCPQPCPCPAPHCGAIYEVMHSIALEEAGISHILNAEGEKIQKAVAISNNIDELICVNESVKRTLTQVTLLEGMLYSKLEAVIGYQNGCHSPHPVPPCPPPCSMLPCCDCNDDLAQNPCE